jgi:hypothetical protein
MIERFKERKTEKSLEQLKKEAEKNFSDSFYKKEVIKSMLKKKSDVRKTYLSLFLIYPERVGKIMEKTFIVKKTLYNHLYNLVSLGLIKKISILDLIKRNGSGLDEEEGLCLEKFNKWTSTMSEGQKQLFTAKTNYWTLDKLGKDTDVIEWALICEKRMKSGDDEDE